MHIANIFVIKPLFFSYYSPQEDYSREQIDWQEVPFSNNQDCIDIIAAKPHGILRILDDQSGFPQVRNNNFLLLFLFLLTPFCNQSSFMGSFLCGFVVLFFWCSFIHIHLLNSLLILSTGNRPHLPSKMSLSPWQQPLVCEAKNAPSRVHHKTLRWKSYLPGTISSVTQAKNRQLKAQPGYSHIYLVHALPAT